MHIDDKHIGNVGTALAKYSEWLNDNEPSNAPVETDDHRMWALTRREVWKLRGEIETYWKSLESSATY
jgi:hypothetical protein